MEIRYLLPHDPSRRFPDILMMNISLLYQNDWRHLPIIALDFSLISILEMSIIDRGIAEIGIAA